MTVFAEDAAFYVNGSVVGVATLDGPILDDASRDIKLGQITSGEQHCSGDTVFFITVCPFDLADSSYNGLMQDIYYYHQALTQR